ncbi:hypothetical protein SAMN02745912_00729 [Paramaledivibacter caminithermalis DSM 15212]|jgi:hypothetical protein|uniref:Uncharacterized protein n=1 Tax=Paramaledivibacter caminithermalis (strain DSM 15212 / CIP 107654 / DViRD3) TaxID=1121301 RepID=A0A1M6LCS4_PARC5|nr:hypothetical protein SAMN02745912_00729 [Paramaledivibacter caminithermalis DSM 15212]
MYKKIVKKCSKILLYGIYDFYKIILEEENGLQRKIKKFAY